MQYELIVETRPAQQIVTFRLLNEAGDYKGSHEIAVTEDRAALWEGLFDTRRHVERYERNLRQDGAAAPETAAAILTRLGVFLGQEVLGAEIMRELTASRARRTLLVKLPPTGADVFAAAFARVPYEIARLAADKPALMECSLVVRMVTTDTAQGDPALTEAAARVASGQEPLRVLLVFAEAPGSQPLGMRQERQELLDLFYRDILPKTRVQVDALCHGVTRAALTEQITSAHGYHIVHWSGHGNLNLLELRGADGQKDLISGEDLARLFDDAGGFMPQIVFLSACLSGTFVNIASWADFEAALLGQRADGKQAPPALPDMLENPPGYTGTALELLRCGVPQVIAMRYEVGDAYARLLAYWFYKRLLADAGQPATDDALALARGDLLKKPEFAGQLDAINHATPLMFGQAGRLLQPVNKRSAQLQKASPKPLPLLPGGSHDLDAPRDFVGRGAELTPLNLTWLSAGAPAVALIQGMAGMGKTALAAEAIHLWFRRFEYVFAFQAKQTELRLDEFYRQFDAKLALNSITYREKCDSSPFDKIYLETSSYLKGDARYEKMRQNLLEALRDEAILLVLDNFETNLMPTPQGYPCNDPRWDAVLRELVRELPATRSRLLLTCRHLPAALAENSDQPHPLAPSPQARGEADSPLHSGRGGGGVSQVLWLRLGPLPHNELGLYITSHPKLAALFFADDDGRALVQRLLVISRGHPLIMNRLAAFADQREKLRETLNALTQTGWERLPDLFATAQTERDRAAERVYLADAATGSIDLLLERLTPAARRLLWLLTQANEPTPAFMLESVWSATPPQPSPTGRESAPLAFGEGTGERLPIEPLFAELTGCGLVTETGGAFAFHELVRERAAAWMRAHEAERGGVTETQLRIAYGERYAALFEALLTSGREDAMDQANEAGRRGLTYLARAQAFDKLSSFASWLVTGTRDPTLLRGVIAELQAVAEQVPAGEARWSLRANLADALRRAGQQDQSLTLYAQAAAEAEDAGNWADVGWICGNWANALGAVGQLDAAKATYRRCVDAYRKANAPKIQIIGNELEALRLDVMQGQAAAALPEIETRLNAVRGWWAQARAGETVPDAPEPVVLARNLVSGLDIAEDANGQLERWDACLTLLTEIEQIKREIGANKQEQFRTRFNQYWPLLKLGRLAEAQRVVEACFAVFAEAGDLTMQSKALSALADIWAARGDLTQASALERQALSICNRLPDPSDRAISHGNLATYLEKAGKADDEASHLLAAIIYDLIAQRNDNLSIWFNNLRIRISRAAQTGGRYELPRVADLLARPEFEALARFVTQRSVEPQELQEAIDQFVEQAR